MEEPMDRATDPNRSTTSTWSSILPAALAGTGVAVMAAMTSAPALSWLDAGDFATASATLGVPHPTGFPLYTLLGHAAMLLPIGNLASRLALLSALCSGLAAFCCVALLRYERASRAIPAAVATLLAFSCVPTLAIHARVPEVYALQLGLTCAGLLCLKRLWDTGDTRYFRGLALICGLGLANHALFRGMAPVLLVAALSVPATRRPRELLWAVLMIAVGLIPYAYLPMAASRGGSHNWGDPSSFERFWVHVNAIEIRNAFASAEPAGMAEAFLELSVVARSFWACLGWAAAVGSIGLMTASCVTVVNLARQKKIHSMWKVGAVAAVLVAGETIYSVWVNPMGNKDYQNGQLMGLFLPLSAALVFERTLFFAARRLRVAGSVLLRWSPVLASVLLCATVLPRADWDFLEISTDFSAEDLAVASLGLAETGAMTVLVSDTMAASHLYVQHALAARPDMAVFERNQLGSSIRGPYALERLPYPVVSSTLVEQWRFSSAPPDEVEFTSRCQAIADHTVNTRPVYWEVSSAGGDLPTDAFAVDLAWPLPRLRRSNSNPESRPTTRQWSPETLDAKWGRAARGSGSQSYRAFVGQQWAYQGRHLFEQGQINEAGQSFERAVALNPDSSAFAVNLAVCLATTGHLAAALPLALDALERSPRNRIALLNAWRYAVALQDRRAMTLLRARASSLEVHLEPQPSVVPSCK